MSYPHIETAEEYREYCEAFRRGTEGFESLTDYRPYVYRLRVSWVELDFRRLWPVIQVSEEIEETAHGRAEAAEAGGYHAGYEAFGRPHCVRVEILSEEPDESGPEFSHLPCDVCDRHLGGDRHPYALHNRGADLVAVDICSDCRYYAEYGQLDDMTMLEIEEAWSRATLVDDRSRRLCSCFRADCGLCSQREVAS